MKEFQNLKVGGGGGIIDARRLTLPLGALAVAVGAGGPAGAVGGISSGDAVGAAPAGAAGAPGAAEYSPTTTSRISGRPVTYGGSGTAISGQGADGAPGAVGDAAQPLQVTVSGGATTVCPGVPLTLQASATGGLAPYGFSWTHNAGNQYCYRFTFGYHDLCGQSQ